MKTYATTGLMVALLAALCFAQDVSQLPQMPEMPKPQKEHEWLHQLAGEWENNCEATPVPGQPSIKMKSTDVARMVGGFWLISEGEGDMMGMPMQTVMTLGYDPEKKKYVGTWLDSASSYLWKYEGTVAADGKKLTLDTEGPCPFRAGKMSKFKEVLEIKAPDHKVFTSSVQEDDGKWTTVVTVDSRRKK